MDHDKAKNGDLPESISALKEQLVSILEQIQDLTTYFEQKGITVKQSYMITRLYIAEIDGLIRRAHSRGVYSNNSGEK